ncbi:MAG: hypothetical protein PVI23_03880, partial [Maricaulaceae bacterium]
MWIPLRKEPKFELRFQNKRDYRSARLRPRGRHRILEDSKDARIGRAAAKVWRAMALASAAPVLCLIVLDLLWRVNLPTEAEKAVFIAAVVGLAVGVPVAIWTYVVQVIRATESARPVSDITAIPGTAWAISLMLLLFAAMFGGIRDPSDLLLFFLIPLVITPIGAA